MCWQLSSRRSDSKTLNRVCRMLHKLIKTFNSIFYSTPQEAVLKALGAE